jgi:HlyD family secretion protein
MQAEVVVDAFPDRKYTGKVTKIAPTDITTAMGQQQGAAGASAVVKYEVEVAMDEAPDELKSGMSAKCTMTVLDRKDVLVLPRQFVGKEKDGSYYVLVAPTSKTDKKAKPTKTKVTIGDSSATAMEILSGVKEGTTVVKPEFTGPSRKGMMEFGPDEESGGGEEGGSSEPASEG